MKTKLFLALLLTANFTFGQQKLTLTLNTTFIGEGIKAYVEYTIKDNNFELYSRSIPGIKKPLLRTDSCVMVKDSIFGKIIIANKVAAIKGRVKDGLVYANLIRISTGEKVGTITSNADEVIVTNYVDLLDSIFVNTEKYIFDTRFLEDKGYLRFKKEMIAMRSFIQDDAEMIALINSKINLLPFSHFSFTKMSKLTLDGYTNTSYDEETKGAFVKNINQTTSLFTIPNFLGNGKLLSDLMKNVISSKVPNLIIDLRGNTGGGAGAAFQLMQHLSSNKKTTGVLLTNKWFAKNNHIPKEEDYSKFKVFNGGSTADIINGMKQFDGIVLETLPAVEQYNGKIYILTDGNTASTCEPIVYGLQYNKKAIIVGEKTAGAMLSKAPVSLQDNYVLFIPLADYYTIDGKRLDKIGVEPNIKTTSAEAITLALEKISEESK